MDMKQHLVRQMVFSRGTFGPGARTEGVIDHIRKELIEVKESGGDPLEWVDVVILALDGLTRALWQSKLISADQAAEKAIELIVGKQSVNERRDWPDWRANDPNKAIEHLRCDK